MKAHRGLKKQLRALEQMIDNGWTPEILLEIVRVDRPATPMDDDERTAISNLYWERSGRPDAPYHVVRT